MDSDFIFSSGKLELKNEGEDFYVEGYISTSDKDLVNDIVTKNCMLDMAEQMRERTIKLDIEHEAFRGKSEMEMQMNKTLIPAAKIEDFVVDKKGLKVRAMLNRHIARFQEVKNSIKDGFLDAFSIAFVPEKDTIELRGGEQVRMLEKIRLLNVAFTGNPINTHAGIEKVFMKSLDYLKANSEEKEEDEDEDSKKKKKKEKEKVGPGGHKPDKTGPHGRGEGPGDGQADGSGTEKKDIHIRDNKIKLQEVKNMTEENKNNQEVEEVEEVKEEVVEEKPAEPVAEPAEVENAEVKALKEEVSSMKKELAEVKAQMVKPLMKSTVEAVDKTKDFEGKSLNPLDLI